MSTVVDPHPKPAESKPHASMAFPSVPGETLNSPSFQGLGSAVACLQAFLGEKDWGSGAAAFATLLSQQMQCHRVALGWVSGQTLRLRVLSNGELLEEGVALTELRQAMLEAAHQQKMLTWPLSHSVDPTRAITIAHQTLYRVQGLSGLVTVPIAQRGVIMGALTLERTVQVDAMQPINLGQSVVSAFNEAELVWLGRLAELMAPALTLRYRLEQPWYERGRGWLESLRVRLADPRERPLRWSVLAFFGAISFGLGLPLPYQVTATARLEAAVQRVVSAPQDGLLSVARVHVGDVVSAGQVLAEMSDDDLQSALRAREAEATKHETALAEAVAHGDRTRAIVARSKLSETKAQIALIGQQIARLC